MRLLLISCLLFVASMAQTESVTMYKTPSSDMCIEVSVPRDCRGGIEAFRNEEYWKREWNQGRCQEIDINFVDITSTTKWSNDVVFDCESDGTYTHFKRREYLKQLPKPNGWYAMMAFYKSRDCIGNPIVTFYRDETFFNVCSSVGEEHSHISYMQHTCENKRFGVTTFETSDCSDDGKEISSLAIGCHNNPDTLSSSLFDLPMGCPKEEMYPLEAETRDSSLGQTLQTARHRMTKEGQSCEQVSIPETCQNGIQHFDQDKFWADWSIGTCQDVDSLFKEMPLPKNGRSHTTFDCDNNGDYVEFFFREFRRRDPRKTVSRHRTKGDEDCEDVTIPGDCFEGLASFQNDIYWQRWTDGTCKDAGENFIDISHTIPQLERSHTTFDCEMDGEWSRFYYKQYMKQLPKPSEWHASLSIFDSNDCSGAPLVTLFRDKSAINSCMLEDSPIESYFMKVSCEDDTTLVGSRHEASDCSDSGIIQGQFHTSCLRNDDFSSQLLNLPFGCPISKKGIDCDAYVAEFASAGGCACMFDHNCDESTYVPEGYNHCAHHAYMYCSSVDPPLVGGMNPMTEEEFLDVWELVIAEEINEQYLSEHLPHQLGLPISAQSQVVAGVNYEFDFSDGTSIFAFHALDAPIAITDHILGNPCPHCPPCPNDMMAICVEVGCVCEPCPLCAACPQGRVPTNAIDEHGCRTCECAPGAVEPSLEQVLVKRKIYPEHDLCEDVQFPLDCKPGITVIETDEYWKSWETGACDELGEEFVDVTSVQEERSSTTLSCDLGKEELTKFYYRKFLKQRSIPEGWYGSKSIYATQDCSGEPVVTIYRDESFLGICLPEGSKSDLFYSTYTCIDDQIVYTRFLTSSCSGEGEIIDSFSSKTCIENKRTQSSESFDLPRGCPEINIQDPEIHKLTGIVIPRGMFGMQKLPNSDSKRVNTQSPSVMDMKSNDCSYYLCFSVNKGVVTDRESCHSFGNYCYWDVKSSTCFGSGPCVNEHAYNCFSSIPFVQDFIPGFPETFEDCKKDLEYCQQCAKDAVSSGLCGSDIRENLPQSCGSGFRAMRCKDKVQGSCDTAWNKYLSSKGRDPEMILRPYPFLNFVEHREADVRPMIATMQSKNHEKNATESTAAKAGFKIHVKESFPDELPMIGVCAKHLCLDEFTGKIYNRTQCEKSKEQGYGCHWDAELETCDANACSSQESLWCAIVTKSLPASETDIMETCGFTQNCEKYLCFEFGTHIDEEKCSSYGENCFWDERENSCHSAGPCISEKAYECFAALPFIRDFEGFPESFETCAASYQCDRCAEEIIANEWCSLIDSSPHELPSIPEACGSMPNICFSHVKQACDEDSSSSSDSDVSAEDYQEEGLSWMELEDRHQREEALKRAEKREERKQEQTRQRQLHPDSGVMRKNPGWDGAMYAGKWQSALSQVQNEGIVQSERLEGLPRRPNYVEALSATPKRFLYYFSGTRVKVEEQEEGVIKILKVNRTTRRCCRAMNAKCLSCALGITEDQFCFIRPKALGCKSERISIRKEATDESKKSTERYEDKDLTEKTDGYKGEDVRMAQISEEEISFGFGWLLDFLIPESDKSRLLPIFPKSSSAFNRLHGVMKEVSTNPESVESGRKNVERTCADEGMCCPDMYSCMKQPGNMETNHTCIGKGDGEVDPIECELNIAEHSQSTCADVGMCCPEAYTCMRPRGEFKDHKHVCVGIGDDQTDPIKCGRDDSDNCTQYTCTRTSGEIVTSEAECHTLGKNCFWDAKNDGICFGLGPCLDKNAHDCYAAHPVFSLYPGLIPESFETCGQEADCKQCAENVVSGGWCPMIESVPHEIDPIPKSCGPNPAVCFQTVKTACTLVFESTMNFDVGANVKPGPSGVVYNGSPIGLLQAALYSMQSEDSSNFDDSGGMVGKSIGVFHEAPLALYAVCDDIHDWTTVEARAICADYEERGWCSNGLPGAAFNSSWTWTSGPNGEILSRRACCECGKKIPPQIYDMEKCQDDMSWFRISVDYEVLTCEDYRKNGWCADNSKIPLLEESSPISWILGILSRKTHQEACCECGRKTKITTRKRADSHWTCTERFNYIDNVPSMRHRYFPLQNGSPVEECKVICLNEIADCKVFWHQQHPTVHACAFYDQLGSMARHNHEDGRVCSYGLLPIQAQQPVVNPLKDVLISKPSSNSRSLPPILQFFTRKIRFGPHPHSTTVAPDHHNLEGQIEILSDSDSDLEWFWILTKLCSTGSETFEHEDKCCNFVPKCHTLPNGDRACSSTTREGPLPSGSCSTCAKIAELDTDCSLWSKKSCVTYPDSSRKCTTEVVDVSDYCPRSCNRNANLLNGSIDEVHIAMCFGRTVDDECMNPYAFQQCVKMRSECGESTKVIGGTCPLQFTCNSVPPMPTTRPNRLLSDPEATDKDMDWFYLLMKLCTTDSEIFEHESECCHYTPECHELPNGDQSCSMTRRRPPLLSGRCSSCAKIAAVDQDCSLWSKTSCTEFPDGSERCSHEEYDISDLCPLSCNPVSKQHPDDEFSIMNIVIGKMITGSRVECMGYSPYSRCMSHDAFRECMHTRSQCGGKARVIRRETCPLKFTCEPLPTAVSHSDRILVTNSDQIKLSVQTVHSVEEDITTSVNPAYKLMEVSSKIDDDIDLFHFLTDLCTNTESFDNERQCCHWEPQCFTHPGGYKICPYAERKPPLPSGPCSSCSKIAQLNGDCALTSVKRCSSHPDGSRKCVSETYDISEFCPHSCSVPLQQSENEIQPLVGNMMTTLDCFGRHLTHRCMSRYSFQQCLYMKDLCGDKVQIISGTCPMQFTCESMLDKLSISQHLVTETAVERDRDVVWFFLLGKLCSGMSNSFRHEKACCGWKDGERARPEIGGSSKCLSCVDFIDINKGCQVEYTADCMADTDGKESCKTLVHDIRDVCPVTCALFEIGVQNPMTQRRLEPVDDSRVGYIQIATGYQCSRGDHGGKEIYTLDPANSCNGWRSTSLEECQQLCTENAVPDKCEVSNPVCEWIIWSEKEGGLCHHAEKCTFEESSNEVQLWSKQVDNDVYLYSKVSDLCTTGSYSFKNEDMCCRFSSACRVGNSCGVQKQRIAPIPNMPCSTCERIVQVFPDCLIPTVKSCTETNEGNEDCVPEVINISELCPASCKGSPNVRKYMEDVSPNNSLLSSLPMAASTETFDHRDKITLMNQQECFLRRSSDRCMNNRAFQLCMKWFAKCGEKLQVNLKTCPVQYSCVQSPGDWFMHYESGRIDLLQDSREGLRRELQNRNTYSGHGSRTRGIALPRTATTSLEAHITPLPECFGMTAHDHCMSPRALQQCLEKKRMCGRNVKYISNSCPRVFSCRALPGDRWLMGAMEEIDQVDAAEEDLISVIRSSETQMQENSADRSMYGILTGVGALPKAHLESHITALPECFGMTAHDHCMSSQALQQCLDKKRICGRNVKYISSSCPRVFSCRALPGDRWLMKAMEEIDQVDAAEEDLISVIRSSETEMQENRCMVWIGDGYCIDADGLELNFVQKDGFLEVGHCLDLCMQTDQCIGVAYETSEEYRCMLYHEPDVKLKGKWDGERRTNSTQKSVHSSTEESGIYCYRTQSGSVCPEVVSPSFITRHKLNKPDGHPDGCQEITIPVFCLNAIFALEEDRTWVPGSCTQHDPEFIEVTQLRPIGIRSFRPLDCDGDGNYQRYKLRSYRRQFPRPSGWHVSLSIYESSDCSGQPLVTLYRGESFLNECTDEGFMFVKKICSDGAIIARGYDTSDCSGHGVDLGEHVSACYEKYGLASESFDMPFACPGPRVCCKALTAECLSCLSGESIEEYCYRKPATVGCPQQEDFFAGISYYEDWPDLINFATQEPSLLHDEILEDRLYTELSSSKWCADNEDRMGICDGSVGDCWDRGLALCERENDSCFGVMVHPGWWTRKFNGVKICTSARMTDKDDWHTRMKHSKSGIVGMHGIKWVEGDFKVGHIFSTPLEVELLSDHHMWTEGPIVIDDALYFCDVQTSEFSEEGYSLGAIWKVDLQAKNREVFIKNSGVAGGFDDGIVSTSIGDQDYDGWMDLGSPGLAYAGYGNMIMCQHGAQRIIMFPMSAVSNGEIDPFAVTVLVDSYDGKSLNSPNDVYLAGDVLYFTDPSYGLQGGKNPDGSDRNHFDLAPQESYKVFTYNMKSGDVDFIIDLGPETTPNGIIVTDIGSGVTRAVIGQTHPFAAILIYDDHGAGFTQTKVIRTDGTGIGIVPENEDLPVFCDGVTLHAGYVFVSCSGGVRVLTVDTLEYAGQLYTNDLNSNNAIADGWLYMTMNKKVIRVKLYEDDITQQERESELLMESILPLFEGEGRIHTLKSEIVAWGYPSDNEAWGRVSPTCYNSQRQSPVDLPSFLVADHRPPLSREYFPVKTKVIDTGHSLQWDLKGMDGVGFHAHISSEHTMMGVQADIEFHFVHKAPDGTFSVTGLLCNAGESDLSFWTDLEHSLDNEVTLNPKSLLDSVNLSKYFTYYGSFTTPPCDEGVLWTVIATLCVIPQSVLSKLNAYPSMESNYRYTQPLNGRIVGGTKRSVSASILSVSPYPGVDVADSYSGKVILRFYGTVATLAFDLTTFDHECLNGAKDTPNSCGIYIHAGSSCADDSHVGGHFWQGDRAEDPWASAIYSQPTGHIVIEFGYDFSDSEGRTLVIHDSNGKRITCDTIARDEIVGDSSPLHKSRMATRTDMLSIWKNRLGTFLETDYKDLVPTLWFFRESIKGTHTDKKK